MTTYNTIGHQYNQTRTADPYIAQTLYNLLQPQPGGRYLDIGCGTGNYTAWLSKNGLDMYGVDPSGLMLEQAGAKSNAVHWQQGNAENIPFENDFFSGAVATLTLHHWADLHAGFTELYRVLKPGSRTVIFTSTAEQMDGYWLHEYFPQMLIDSIKQMPSQTSIEQAAAQAGFAVTALHKYFVKDDLQDKFLYVGKNNPLLYFDPAIRNGISSFAALANKAEVQRGLLRLRAHIDFKKFEDIKSRYENDEGDYLFVVLEK